jgi:Arc/MetJ family transcription regulator
MQLMMHISYGDKPMRTTIALDDELLADAKEYTGLTETSAIVREALKALVEREAARRLARLGGTAPGMKSIPRRKSKKTA